MALKPYDPAAALAARAAELGDEATHDRRAAIARELVAEQRAEQLKPPPRRRRAALVFTDRELLEALRSAGYAIPDGTALITVEHSIEREQFRVVLQGDGYPPVDPGSEAPNYPAVSVLAGQVEIAKAAAERAGLQLVKIDVT